ncbi:nuclear transport factor 2 family protein [Embleya sp. NPDC005575]|uniref:nuclear transport factor 2 family protein n=1 Tax=Embleya sp. NPDC005575 TaxID=3156892 RepID=UPI0033A84CF9
MTGLIDARRTWELAEKRLAAEVDPRRRAILTTLVAHMRAEHEGDLDALMATVSPRAVYHQWGASPVDRAPKTHAEVREFHRAVVENDCGRLAHHIDRLTVDQDTVVTEGLLRIAYPGRTLARMGRSVSDVDAFYLYEAQMAIVWGFDADALVVCEDSYSTGDGFADMRRLDPDEVPARKGV